MPVWPFKRRRDSAAALKDPTAPRPRKRSFTDPNTSHPSTWSPRTQDSDAAAAAPAPDVPRCSEKPGRQHTISRLHRRMSSQADKPFPSADYLENMSMVKDAQQAVAPGKENVPRNTAATSDSREDITALPMSQRLQQSPHLRPIELDRSPFIPYSFQSQPRLLSSRTGSQKTLPPSTKRSATLRSRRSDIRGAATPERRLSQKQQKPVREEEIRAMSMPMSIPKRPGDGPLHRDSKKVRNSLLARESIISLPAAESIRSSMNPIAEQRGWEIGILDSFSPRPAVRLSGTPQYVHPGTPVTATREKLHKDEQLRQEERMFAAQKEAIDKEYLIEKSAEKRKDKRPTSAKRSRSKKRQTIGAAVDGLDSSDLRILLERDAKRKEERRKARQDKLDRKLRRRADSDKRRQNADQVHMTEDERQRHEELRRLRGFITPGMSPPTAIHPALRDSETPKTVGLGIEHDGQPTPTGPRKESNPFLTPQASQESDRFLQPQPSAEFGSDALHTPLEGPAPTASRSEHALASPLEEDEYDEDEDVVVNTAKAVRYSQTMTNPISEVDSKPQTAPVISRDDHRSLPQQRAPAQVSAPVSRQGSEFHAKRSSGWAAFFRRRTQRKSVGTGASEPSFSNTSRESMRHQPIPPHLVDMQARSQPSLERMSSGTPVRTMSRFREDLPEMPSSPTESHTSDLTAAAARVPRRVGPEIPDQTIAEDDVETPRPLDSTIRSDTPISPKRGKLSNSMASVGSEGSWLASGSVKRKSRPTSLNRATGSLSKRNPNFVASYEELGEDQDAAYVKLSGGVRRSDDQSPVESDGIESRLEFNDAPTVHESVRRRPTLGSGPRVQSREGLITEFANAGESPPDPHPRPEDVDLFGQDSPGPQVHSATSVNFGPGHVRQISAGSARVLEIPRRDSSDRRSPISHNAPASANPFRNSGLSGQHQPGFT